MRWTTSTPHGEVIVEEGRPDDGRALFALRYEVLSEERYFITEAHEFTSSVDGMTRFAQDLRDSENSVLLVARLDDRLVGYLTIQGGMLRRMRHTGKLEILVSPMERGSGIGHALMAACIEWAESNAHLAKIGLNVFSDNERAIALYERFDFEIEGRRCREYRMADGTWRDDVLMYRFVD